MNLNKIKIWLRQTRKGVELTKLMPQNCIQNWHLGYMYTFNYSTATNVNDAIYWFEKSVSRNNVFALFNLAVFYIEGYGFQKDLSKGAELLAKAAALNSPAAQFNLLPR